MAHPISTSSTLRLAAAFVTASFLVGPVGPAIAAGDDSTLQIRWLGVAGFSFTAGETTVLQDPFFSRPGMLRTLFRRYSPDERAIDYALRADGPAPELANASLIVAGHSHYDHSADLAAVALQSGARVAGSETTGYIVRAYGLPPARSVIAPLGAQLAEGPFDIEVIESRHAKVLLGRVPMPGSIDEPIEAPIHAFSFPLGDARAYRLTHRESGLRIFMTSSAALHAPAVEALEGGADVLLLASAGREPEYVETLVKTLRPRLVIPHHDDSFFVPIDDADAGKPSDSDDFRLFEQEVKRAAADAGLGVEVRRLDLWEAILLPQALAGSGGD
jgi:L-ascorbate metabolism protein UlaG (beta-lactamase superfamily)